MGCRFALTLPPSTTYQSVGLEELQPDIPTRFAVSRDPLAQVTDEVRLTSLFCSIMRATPPFSVKGASEGFHVILVTHREVYLEGTRPGVLGPLLVQAGDVLVMPRGVPFRFFYPLDAPHPLDTIEHVARPSAPRRNEVELLGMVSFLDKTHRNLLTDFLPQVIHLKKGTPGLTRWLKKTIDLFRSEYWSTAPGRGSILSRLVEIVSVQALRIWIEQMPAESKGWLQGLRDERIAAALHAIHKKPGHRWTVASLAREAGMSRTVFSTRFKKLVGRSPMEYVSHWRMHHAVGLLDVPSENLKSVVEASGYKSDTTFRANFKRSFGILPSDYRRKQPAGA
jgi:AraC-like DNA-binding protein